MQAFAEREGVRPRTLLWWRWKLGSDARVHAQAGDRGAERHVPQFLEVVLPRAEPRPGDRSAIELIVGERRIAVSPGFDEATLLRVLAVLEGR